MKDFSEKRKFKRVKGTFRVNFIPNSDLVLNFSCDCRDISEGGIGIAIIAEPIPGRDVEVVFKLPNSPDELKIPSEVVWVRPSEQFRSKFEAGIKFYSLSGETRQLLKEYIAKSS